MKTVLIIFIVLIIVGFIIDVLTGFSYKLMNKPVGLFVVRPDINFFECARIVHGNYKFYYEPSSQEFMFERAGEICYVNTMQFREKYFKLYGRSPEVFIKEV